MNNEARAELTAEQLEALTEQDEAAQQQMQARARREIHRHELRRADESGDGQSAGTQTDGQSAPAMPTARPASGFGKCEHSFLWNPYIPRKEYSLIIADSGTGKTYLLCKIAAELSQGRQLYGDGSRIYTARKQKTLFVSSEDDGETLRERLEKCGADLEQIFICDRTDSIGLCFTTEGFGAMLDKVKPDLVILDPWQAFVAESVDVNRMNQMRRVLQKLSSVAREHDCAIVLISHVNKRAQDSNANHAAAGSGELVNAARSAMILVYDDSDPERTNRRILVHTKANHAALGESLLIQIDGDGLQFVGKSPVTKSTLELKARRRSTLADAQSQQRRDKSNFGELCAAIHAALRESGERETRCTYRRLEALSSAGSAIWNGGREYKAIEAVKLKMQAEGVDIIPLEKKFRDGGSKSAGAGILIRLIDGEPHAELEEIDELFADLI